MFITNADRLRLFGGGVPTPGQAPNPTCCSDPRRMCVKCRTAALTTNRRVDPTGGLSLPPGLLDGVGDDQQPTANARPQPVATGTVDPKGGLPIPVMDYSQHGD